MTGRLEPARDVPISVLLADDQPLARAGLRTLLETCDQIRVVGEAEFATRPAREPPAAARLGVLTDREREVLALVGDGLANEAIAKRLFMGLGDREDARQPDHGQARGPRPRPARGDRLRDGPGPAGLAVSAGQRLHPTG
jgi:hypothetical protein